jgi:hypothetical protein
LDGGWEEPALSFISHHGQQDFVKGPSLIHLISQQCLSSGRKLPNHKPHACYLNDVLFPSAVMAGVVNYLSGNWAVASLKMSVMDNRADREGN